MAGLATMSVTGRGLDGEGRVGGLQLRTVSAGAAEHGGVLYSIGEGGGGERFISTAQNFEDVMLWRALSTVTDGFYIDVGAGDPDVESVTRPFYDRGWSGVNVEPAEGAWRRLCARRPRDVNLRLAVGDTVGRRPFFLIDEGGGLSTLRTDVNKVHLANGHSFDEVSCEVVTLARICEDHVARPIHFLKIDVEGGEREVLEGADFERYRPWVVVVEATYPNSRVQTHLEWEGLLTARSYRFAYFDGLNRFYVAEERWQRVGDAFAQPPNVFDNFIRSDEATAVSRAASAERDAAAAADRARAAEQRAGEAKREATAAVERVRVAECAVAAAQAKLAAVRAEAERARAERDAYEQEVFEVNRHAAWSEQERQNLVWRIDGLQRDRDGLADEIRRHKEWIDAIYSSTSWRFARPVRAARRFLNLVSGRG